MKTTTSSPAMQARLALAESEAEHWYNEYRKLSDRYDKLFDQCCAKIESTLNLVMSNSTSTHVLRSRLNNIQVESRRNQVFNLKNLRHE